MIRSELVQQGRRSLRLARALLARQPLLAATPAGLILPRALGLAAESRGRRRPAVWPPDTRRWQPEALGSLPADRASRVEDERPEAEQTLEAEAQAETASPEGVSDGAGTVLGTATDLMSTAPADVTGSIRRRAELAPRAGRGEEPAAPTADRPAGAEPVAPRPTILPARPSTDMPSLQPSLEPSGAPARLAQAAADRLGSSETAPQTGELSPQPRRAAASIAERSIGAPSPAGPTARTGPIAPSSPTGPVAPVASDAAMAPTEAGDAVLPRGALPSAPEPSRPAAAAAPGTLASVYRQPVADEAGEIATAGEPASLDQPAATLAPAVLAGPRSTARELPEVGLLAAPAKPGEPEPAAPGEIAAAAVASQLAVPGRVYRAVGEPPAGAPEGTYPAPSEAQPVAAAAFVPPPSDEPRPVALADVRPTVGEAQAGGTGVAAGMAVESRPITPGTAYQTTGEVESGAPARVIQPSAKAEARDTGDAGQPASPGQSAGVSALALSAGARPATRESPMVGREEAPARSGEAGLGAPVGEVESSGAGATGVPGAGGPGRVYRTVGEPPRPGAPGEALATPVGGELTAPGGVGPPAGAPTSPLARAPERAGPWEPGSAVSEGSSQAGEVPVGREARLAPSPVEPVIPPEPGGAAAAPPAVVLLAPSIASTPAVGPAVGQTLSDTSVGEEAARGRQTTSLPPLAVGPSTSGGTDRAIQREASGGSEAPLARTAGEAPGAPGVEAGGGAVSAVAPEMASDTGETPEPRARGDVSPAPASRDSGVASSPTGRPAVLEASAAAAPAAGAPRVELAARPVEQATPIAPARPLEPHTGGEPIAELARSPGPAGASGAALAVPPPSAPTAEEPASAAPGETEAATAVWAPEAIPSPAAPEPGVIPRRPAEGDVAAPRSASARPAPVSRLEEFVGARRPPTGRSRVGPANGDRAPSSAASRLSAQSSAAGTPIEAVGAGGDAAPEMAGRDAAPRDDIDRSPQAWAGRLRQMLTEIAARSGQARAPSASPKPEAEPVPVSRAAEVPAAPPPAEEVAGLPAATVAAELAQPGAAPPAPVSGSARRFLRPLVGVDAAMVVARPLSVRLHRGAAADRAASSRGADAIAVGDDVALAAGHEGETPENLGLLAHELTHVARQREPRFVPPVARSARPVVEGGAPEASPAPELTGEEALASSVEARVTRTARAQAARFPSTEPTTEAAAGEVSVPQASRPESAPAPRPVGPRPVRAPAAATRDWGGLPAPWEPLPDWVTSPTATPGSLVAPAPLVRPTPSGAGSVVYRAEADGSAPAETAPAAPASAAEEGAGAPEPDLDALAKQVYAILKRRLAAERRRHGLT